MWSVIGRLMAGLNLIAAFTIIGLMLLITADVIGRVFLLRPIAGVPEIVKLSIVCIAWLQIAYTTRVRRHLSSTLILDLLPRMPRRAILVLNCLVGALMMGLIAYFTYPELLRSWRLGVFEGERPVRVPVWPIWGVIVMCSALTALEFVGQAIQAALGHQDDDPGPPHGIA